MSNSTWQGGVVVSLVAVVLAVLAGCGSTSVSLTTPRTTSGSSGLTTPRPPQQSNSTFPNMLSLVAGRRVHNLGPGPATMVSLSDPGGVAVDARGDLFIADTGNNLVEKVTPAGRLSVVAGGGETGPQVSGPATSSELEDPSGVAVDARGDLFIADTGNDVVEKVTPTGRLSVVAGGGEIWPLMPGPATSTELHGPSGVAVNAHGDLFIADTGNDVVEKVTPAGRLSVVAGNGQAGPPTPGPATSSSLDGPEGVAVDAYGDLFIADTLNDVVEEITPTGRLSVVTGEAVNYDLPTPGPATSSELYNPAGVAVDARGDLFIADTHNNVVEEVSPAGRLSVVAGVATGVVGEAGPPTPGPATSSRLGFEQGVAADARGQLFIADTSNDVVEDVTPAGRLSVVAGEGDQAGPPTPGQATNSELNEPYGVAVDARGDLFIADTGNDVVEKVTAAGRLSVVAGIADQPGPPKRGPADRSKLAGPFKVAVDARGDLFISDEGNYDVEEVTASGRLSVVAGDGQPGRPTPGPAIGPGLGNEPDGVAVNSRGDLFIAEYGNAVVEEVNTTGRLSVVAGVVDQSGPPIAGPATSSELESPSGVAVDARGDLFIADEGNDVVEEVNPSGMLSVVAGVVGKFGPPTPGPATSSELESPSGVAVDARGDLFIADEGNDVVEEVNPSGMLSVVAGVIGKHGPPTPGPATSSDLYDPQAVSIDTAGDLFIADTNNNDIEKVRLTVTHVAARPTTTTTATTTTTTTNSQTSSGTLSLIAGPGTRFSLSYPSGVAVDARGDLFIAETGKAVVEELTPTGRSSVVAGIAGKFGQPTPGPATSSKLRLPEGVAVDARGDLFIADDFNDVVEKVTPAGRLSIVAGIAGKAGPPTPGLATSSVLDGPEGVAVDAHGDLFIADGGNGVVEEVTPTGKLSVVAGVAGDHGLPSPGPATSSEFDSPYGIAVDAHGDLFIADSLGDVVDEVTPAGTLSVVAGVVDINGSPPPGPATNTALNDPQGVTVDAAGDLFIADYANSVVYEVTPARMLSVVAGDGEKGAPTPGPATSSMLLSPTGVAVDAHGDLFIADWLDNVIAKVRL